MLTQKFQFFETTFSLTILLNLEQYHTSRKKENKRIRLAIKVCNWGKFLYFKHFFLQTLRLLFPTVSFLKQGGNPIKTLNHQNRTQLLIKKKWALITKHEWIILQVWNTISVGQWYWLPTNDFRICLSIL